MLDHAEKQKNNISCAKWRPALRSTTRSSRRWRAADHGVRRGYRVRHAGPAGIWIVAQGDRGRFRGVPHRLRRAGRAASWRSAKRRPPSASGSLTEPRVWRSITSTTYDALTCATRTNNVEDVMPPAAGKELRPESDGVRWMKDFRIGAGNGALLGWGHAAVSRHRRAATSIKPAERYRRPSSVHVGGPDTHQ